VYQSDKALQPVDGRAEALGCRALASAQEEEEKGCRAWRLGSCDQCCEQTTTSRRDIINARASSCAGFELEAAQGSRWQHVATAAACLSGLTRETMGGG